MKELQYYKPDQEQRFLRKHRSDLEEFEKRFTTEDVCKKRLEEWKWPEGFKCSKCGHNKNYYNASKKLYECRQCQFQHSLMTDTIFHRTRTPLKAWFYMIFVMGLTNRGVIPRENFLKYLGKLEAGNHYKALKRIGSIINLMPEKEFNWYLDLVKYLKE